jgi:hypothetical protein
LKFQEETPKFPNSPLPDADEMRIHAGYVRLVA